MRTDRTVRRSTAARSREGRARSAVAREATPAAEVVAESASPAAFAAAAVSALWRGAVAAAAGGVLVAGLALMWWAITPAAGITPADAVRGGMIALAAAHFLPVTIEGAELTLRPLLLTGAILGIVITSVGRARVPRGPAVDLVHAAVFAVIYAIVVDVTVTLLAPDDAVRAGLAAPLAIAALGAALALCAPHSTVRRWWRATVPRAVAVGVRAGAAGVIALFAGGALLLAAAMISAFPDTMAVTELTVHSMSDGIGLAAVGLAFVPNAVIAAIGYASGAGFSIGQASFSPLLVHRADLPAVPLLAAAPGDTGPGGYAALAVPVIAALVVAAVVVRGVGARGERLIACAVAALAAGVATVALAAAAAGGVSGGPWAQTGAPALLTGGLIAGGFALIAGAIAGGRRPVAAPGPPAGVTPDGAGTVINNDGAAAEGDTAAESDTAGEDREPGSPATEQPPLR